MHSTTSHSSAYTQRDRITKWKNKRLSRRVNVKRMPTVQKLMKYCSDVSDTNMQ